jgi:hypothetical protein
LSGWDDSRCKFLPNRDAIDAGTLHSGADGYAWNDGVAVNRRLTVNVALRYWSRQMLLDACWISGETTLNGVVMILSKQPAFESTSGGSTSKNQDKTSRQDPEDLWSSPVRIRTVVVVRETSARIRIAYDENLRCN